jgi:hypothetical protein
MATRTRDEVVLDLITNILRSSEQADTFPGQVIRDIVVNSPSAEFENLYNQLDRLSLSQSIANANLMTTQELDDLVSNYGITRRGSQKAFGQVTFYTPTVPSSIVRIPQGTSLGTNIGVTSKEITFSTRTDAVFDPALEGVYFNPNTGNYEITVDIVSDNPGTEGNVGPYTITKVRNGNFPFNVTNQNSTTGGVDQESNNDLAIRALNILLGSNVGTKTGYEGTVLSQDSVLDALVVGPGDPLMTRDGGFGGKVDIWTVTSPISYVQQSPDNNPDTIIANWNYADQFTRGFEYNFPLLPVDANSPLTVTASTSPSGNITNVLLYESRSPAPSGVDYVNPSGARYHYTAFIADDNETAHSVRANDYILWNPDEMEYLRTFNPSGTPYSGNILSVNIAYSYNQTINTVQGVVDADDRHIITADVLVKEAQKILVDVDMDVVLYKQFKETAVTEQTTIANVEDAIRSAINNTQLGNTVEESDLIQAAHNVEGVDNVIVNSVRITKKRSELFDVAQQQITDETSAPNQYFESDLITVESV